MLLLIVGAFGAWGVYYALHAGLALSPVPAAAISAGFQIAVSRGDLRRGDPLPWASLGLLCLIALNAAVLRSALIADNTFALSYVVYAAIGLVSLAAGKPFTLRYAKRDVPPEKWAHPVFLRINTILTSLWTGIFVVNALLNAIPALAGRESVVRSLSYTITALGLVLTAEFPGWYRKRAKARQAA